MLTDGGEAWITSNTQHLTLFPDAGTLSDLRIELAGAPGAGSSVSFTVRQDTGAGPVATALTCTVSGTATDCHDTSNSITVAPGDMLDIEASPAGAPVASHVHYTAKYLSDTANHSMLTGKAEDGSDTYLALHGAFSSATEFKAETIFPTNGALTSLRVNLSDAPGVGQSRSFTVNKNGSPTALSCTILDAATTCSDTVNSATFAAGDTAVLVHTKSGAVADTTRIRNATVFNPSTPGEFIIAMGNEQNTNTASSRYYAVNTGDHNTSGDEGDKDQLAQAMTIKAIHVEMDTDPDDGGAGEAYQFTLRQNGSDTALHCLVSTGSTTCNGAANVAIADDDLLSMQLTPNNSPATCSSFHVSFVATAQ